MALSTHTNSIFSIIMVIVYY